MTSEPTKLRFPKGPHEILQQGVKILDSYVDRNSYEIGGGTVLAARWQHRHSTDVDLFISTDSYNKMYRQNGDPLQSTLRELEQTGQLRVIQLNEQALVVDFPSLGNLSLVASPTVLPNQEPRQQEETTGIHLEPTEEILAKKVVFRVASIQWKERDFFDLVVASKCDSKAYAVASDLLGEEHKRDTAIVLRARLSRPYALQRGSIIEPYNIHVAEATWELAADLLEGRQIEIPHP